MAGHLGARDGYETMSDNVEICTTDMNEEKKEAVLWRFLSKGSFFSISNKKWVI